MQKDKQAWTIISLLQKSVSFLQEKHFRQPRLAAELLLAFALNLRRIDLYLQFDRPLTEEEVSRYRTLLQRRLLHEPLQYIIGETEFMSLPFYVGPGVLIPRPETEILVEKALQYCKERMGSENEIRVLDVGTGSGNIAISLLRYNERCHAVGIDVSEKALDYAKRNADRHHVSDRIEFLQHDVREEIPRPWKGVFDLVVANPPYIRSQEYDLLDEEIKRYEPKEALWGGDDGMEYYRLLSQKLPPLLRSGGHIFLEIGADMGEAVKKIFNQNYFHDIQIIPDLAGKDRILSLSFKERGKP